MRIQTSWLYSKQLNSAEDSVIRASRLYVNFNDHSASCGSTLSLEVNEVTPLISIKNESKQYSSKTIHCKVYLPHNLKYIWISFYKSEKQDSRTIKLNMKFFSSLFVPYLQRTFLNLKYCRSKHKRDSCTFPML